MSRKRTFRQPPNFLNVRKLANTALDSEDRIYWSILELEFEGGNTIPNIQVRGQFPGMVPPFVEHRARRKSGYNIHEWRSIDYMDRAIEVALYLLEIRLEAEEYEATK